MTVSDPIRPVSDRQASIVRRVETDGFVTVQGLAATFGVSAQTVRRDIIELARAGRLQRFHGGAGPVAAEAARLGHGAKREIDRPEKAAAGAHAAAAMPDRATLFLDVGTTIEACARALAARPGFRVFTSSLRAALSFDPSEHDVHVIGGRLAGRDGALVGEEVILRLRDVQLDCALIACSGIDDRRRVMDFDPSKIAVKKAAMAASRRSCLVATSSKFGRTALAAIGTLDDFDAVFTEGGEEGSARSGPSRS